MAADKEQQSPIYPANAYQRSADTEAAAASNDAREQKKKKRIKILVYVILFVIFQSAVIAVFAVTIMKVRTPRFRIHNAAITSLNTASSSLQASITPDFSFKNANFGRYKYRNTTVDFFYRGVKVGEVFIPNSKAGWRSTKRFIPSAVELTISSTPQLSTDLSAGIVPITTSAQMRGRVELMFIMKKNKNTNMNCTMEIVTATQSFRNIVCK